MRSVIKVLRSSGVAGIVIAGSFAISIGSSAMVLAIADRLFLDSPPGVEKPEYVRRIYLSGSSGQPIQPDFSYSDVLLFDQASQPAAEVAAYEIFADRFLHGANALINTAVVGRSYFEVLGVKPRLGRFFVDEEQRVGDPRQVMVVSHAFWQRFLGGDEKILGSSLVVDSSRVVIVGVAPKGFAGIDLDEIDVWFPLPARPAPVGFDWNDRRQAYLRVLVRLRKGGSDESIIGLLGTRYEHALHGAPSTVEAERKLIMTELVRAPERESFRPDFRRAIGLTTRLATIVMIVTIVCMANAATLLTLRSIVSQPALAVHTALGATPWRLTRIASTEALSFALVGGLIAGVIGWFGTELIRTQLFINPRWATSVSPQRYLVLVAVLTLLGAALLALVPAQMAMRLRVGLLLRYGIAVVVPPGRVLRFAVTVAHITLCVFLGTNLVMLGGGVHSTYAGEVGFLEDGLVSVSVAGRPVNAQSAANLMRDLRQLPWVTDVSNADSDIPFGLRALEVRSANARQAAPMQVRLSYVDTAYFRALGLQVIQGRHFGAHDGAGAEPVAVLSQALARQMSRNGSIVGHCIGVGDFPCVRVTGVVQDVRWHPLEDAPYQLYRPLQQATRNFGHFFVIRSAASTATDLVQLRSLVARSVGWVPPARIHLVSQRRAPLERPLRITAYVTGIVSLVAFAAMALGIHGLVTYDIVLRTRELNVRASLGATRTMLMTSALRQPLLALLTGLLVGFVVATSFREFVVALVPDGRSIFPRAVAASCLVVLSVGALTTIHASHRAGTKAAKLLPAL